MPGSFNKGLIEIYRLGLTDNVQRIVFEAYIDKGYTTSRGLAIYFGITHTSAYYLIKELKQNLNNLQYRYESESTY
jgi:phage regulator Rha-like protein